MHASTDKEVTFFGSRFICTDDMGIGDGDAMHFSTEKDFPYAGKWCNRMASDLQITHSMNDNDF